MFSDKIINVRRKGENFVAEEPKPVDPRTKSALIVGGSIVGAALIGGVLRFFRNLVRF